MLGSSFTYKSHFVTISLLGAQQKLMLLTLFALSVKYQAVDLSLAVSSGLLPLLSQLCGSASALAQAAQAVVYHSGHCDLAILLKVASLRLLQILAMTAG